MTRNACLLGCLACSLLYVSSPDRAAAQSAEKPAASARHFKPRTVIRRAFRPITEPQVIQAAEVTDQVSANELVLGVVVNGDARAYPINMLHGPSREIINDDLGGQAIAATW